MPGRKEGECREGKKERERERAPNEAILPLEKSFPTLEVCTTMLIRNKSMRLQ